MPDDRKKESSGSTGEDHLPQPEVTGPGTQSRAVELFKSLTEEEQDEVLRCILSEGGVKRILAALGARESPGALEVFLDAVEYYHFLPVVNGE